MARRIQRAWRAHIRYKNQCAAKIQRYWRQNKYNIGFLQLRDHGHELLAGRKERRRFSLLSQRIFLGDYLDVKKGSGVGKLIQNAIQLKPGEQVEFSMRGSMLVPRAMRSSVPSLRTFVLVTILYKKVDLIFIFFYRPIKTFMLLFLPRMEGQFK